MNKFTDFTRQVFQGKSIYRILFNWQVAKYCQSLRGKCVDLGSGKRPSYSKYWSLKSSAELIRGDINVAKKADLVVDLNKPLPFEDNSIDNIFLFNVIYIIREPENLMKEIYRVLKKDGQFFMASPYLTNEMKEPDDFRRLTGQGVEDLIIAGGFSDFEIMPFGERATAGVHLWHPLFVFNLVRFAVFACALFFDKLVPRRIRKLHPCPLGYFVVGKKM